jgi:hypothetical protein
MSHSTALEALQSGRCLELRYDGFNRLVEVHAVGVSTADNPCMSVYQVEGGSVSGERMGFKTMTFDKAFTAYVSDTPSAAPRPGFVRNAKGMKVIYAQV